jgi:ABC-type Fe3+/spermidine/putrescine transport system ATPase subunit
MVADFMGLVNLVQGEVRSVRNGGGSVQVGDLTLDIAALDGLAPGDAVDVAIRPENITLLPPQGALPGNSAEITNHVFLGNISEYYATLASGQTLRVQTHPRQHFAVGEKVAVEVEATQCSVFRRAAGDAKPA